MPKSCHISAFCSRPKFNFIASPRSSSPISSPTPPIPKLASFFFRPLCFATARDAPDNPLKGVVRSGPPRNSTPISVAAMPRFLAYEVPSSSSYGSGSSGLNALYLFTAMRSRMVADHAETGALKATCVPALASVSRPDTAILAACLPSAPPPAAVSTERRSPCTARDPVPKTFAPRALLPSSTAVFSTPFLTIPPPTAIDAADSTT